MIRYRLDDLGWYQFEWLTQALLKAELGLGIESWGGTADCGRDAYFTGSLNYPAKHIVTDGAFLFQAKFVQNANSSGSKPEPSILKSVKEELGRIEDRIEKNKWNDVDHYTLLTNAVLSGGTREKIKNLITGKLPQTKIHTFGGQDICDLLDRNSQLRRSFPQLLSLRDLDSLISDNLNKETIQRSQAALNFARDIVPSFVPTQPYNRAWKVLQENNFVVLEGPPEMGKTAIAWMIALAQFSQGWEAIVCRDPSDFFESYKKDDSQVFIADDAFGRTEYDPGRLKKWELDLDRIIRTLNPRHWLIWTSRKHILERARNQMDLQGKASKFPDPGAVLVNASILNVEEKALILYRHARSNDLENEAKNIIRGNAYGIVQNANFTPERIRRFIQDTLPALVVKSHSGELKVGTLATEVQNAIKHPTEGMRKSFEGLPESHRWALIALLEAGNYPTKDEICKIYETLCPNEKQNSFDEVYEELCESFLKPVVVTFFTGATVTTEWIHPSYKDLVIEELGKSRSLQMDYFQNIGLEGIKLAISEKGGVRGERSFPLMQFPESWDLLKKRCLALPKILSVEEITEMLVSFRNSLLAVKDENSKAELLEMISLVCQMAKEKWDSERVKLTSEQLEAYCEASLLLKSLPPIPDIQMSWDRDENAFRYSIDEAESEKYFSPDHLNQFVRLARVIQDNEPRFLRQIGFPSKFAGDFVRLISILEEEIDSAPFLDSVTDLRDEAGRINSIVDGLNLLVKFDSISEIIPGLIEGIIKKLQDRAESYEEEANQLDPGEPDYEGEGYGGKGFSIEALFVDL